MLDQHLMVDKDVLIRIINVADLNKNDIVLEIGPGTGNLTEYLAKIAKKVIVIEKDKKFLPVLTERFANAKHVMFIFDDATKAGFPEFTKCVSNLPYTICEPLLWKFTRHEFEMLVFVVPKQFTDLLTGKKKSRLRLLVEAFYEVDVLDDIPPMAFDPPPKVMSSLIRITPRKDGNFFLREFFSQYDKKTKNALREILVRSGLTKRDAMEQIALRVRPKIQEKNIVNLSLDEIHGIVEKFAVA